MALQLVEVTPENFATWRSMRAVLYSDLTSEFHERETQLIAVASDRTCFLAWLHGEPVGFVELSLRNVVDGCLGAPVGYLEGIYVIPEHRGQGYSRRMVDFAADWFRAQGCTEMASDALLENSGAQSFHKRLGFEETFRIVEFKRRL